MKLALSASQVYTNRILFRDIQEEIILIRQYLLLIKSSFYHLINFHFDKLIVLSTSFITFKVPILGAYQFILYLKKHHSYSHLYIKKKFFLFSFWDICSDSGFNSILDLTLFLLESKIASLLVQLWSSRGIPTVLNVCIWSSISNLLSTFLYLFADRTCSAKASNKESKTYLTILWYWLAYKY